MSAERSAPECARSWEVEAVRDGRLRGNDADSLRRHLQTCAACQREETALDALHHGLAELPRPRLDALAGRRIRQRVLTDHNAWLLRQDRGAAPWRRPRPWVLAASLVALAGAGWWQRSRGTDAALLVARPPLVDVVASAGALWSRKATAHEVRVTLERGELRLGITRDNPKDRVLVVVPDGEIEDFGTVFRVAASAGSTDSVHVEQGSVVMRLRDHAPLRLTAGQAWQRDEGEPVSAASAAPSAAPSAALVPQASSSPRGEPEGRRHTMSRTRAQPLEAAPPSSSDVAGARAEDDAYLHLIELVRQGRGEEARTAAKDYLLRFPNGFRRIEVLNIATRQ